MLSFDRECCRVNADTFGRPEDVFHIDGETSLSEAGHNPEVRRVAPRPAAPRGVPPRGVLDRGGPALWRGPARGPETLEALPKRRTQVFLKVFDVVLGAFKGDTHRSRRG